MNYLSENIAQQILSTNDLDLEDLQAFWEISRPEGNRDRRNYIQLQKLAEALLSPWPAMAAVEKLTDIQRDCLRLILKAEIPYTVAELGQATGAGAGIINQLRPLLNNLVLAPPFRSWGPRRSQSSAGLTDESHLAALRGLDTFLERALSLYNSSPETVLQTSLPELVMALNLHDLGGALGLSSSALRSVAPWLPLITASCLRQTGRVERLMAHLHARPRRVFQELVEANGPVTLDHLFGAGAPAEITAVLHELYCFGLVFPVFIDKRRGCFVPPEVAAAARGQETPRPSPSPELRPVAVTPDLTSSTGAGLWWNMMLVSLWVGRSGELTSTDHRIPKKALKEMAKAVAAATATALDDLDRAEIAFDWLLLSGAIAYNGNTVVHTSGYGQWLEASLEAQAARLLGSWIAAAQQLEWMIPSLPGLADRVQATLEVRRRLLAWLTALQAGKWYRLADLRDYVLAREPFFVRSAQQLRLLMGEIGIDDLFHSWHYYEGRAIVQQLFHLPLASGIVELGWSSCPVTGSEAVAEFLATAPPDLFRVSELGHRILSQVELPVEKAGAPKGRRAVEPLRLKEPVGPPPRTLILQPTLQVTMLEFDPRVAYAVSAFATPVGFDRVATFELNAASVRYAAAHGLDAAAIIETLQRFAARPVPQNVEYQIRDWAAAVHKVRFERATLIETDTPEEMDQLLAAKPMKSRLRRRVSPTAALIAVGEDLKALARLLEPLGFNWTPPADWETNEEETHRSINRTLKRFQKEPPRRGWGR